MQRSARSLTMKLTETLASRLVSGVLMHILWPACWQADCRQLSVQPSASVPALGIVHVTVSCLLAIVCMDTSTFAVS